MKDFTFELIDKAHKMIHTKKFCDKHKLYESSFTRLRRMGFTAIMLLCLNFLKKSLQVEIDRFMELTDPEIERPITKQAFSKARQKISPDAFRELFEMTGQSAAEEDVFRRYNGYRVFAVDGTELQLPQSDEISRKYRQTRNSFCPHARASAFCDVMTGLTVHACIDTTETGERELAMEHLRYFEVFKGNKDIVIFDRGYPSRAMIKYLDESGYKYLMRLQKSFHTQIDNTDRKDFYVRIDGCNVRAIKLILPGGETETLITNLGRPAFKTAQFMELYHLRWGIETKFNTLKNKLDIESFSGKTLTTVLQDFYATLFLSNISAAIKAESDEIISDDNTDKHLKHEYITNENVLIGRLKDKLVLILLNPDAYARGLLLDKLIVQISRYRTAIVPGRCFQHPVTAHKRACCKLKKAL